MRNQSSVFAGQSIGIREVDDQIWLVSFLEHDLGYFDREWGRVEPGPIPLVPDKVLTMCPVNTPEKIGAPDRIDSDRLWEIFSLKGAFGVQNANAFRRTCDSCLRSTLFLL